MFEIENEEVSWKALDIPINGTITRPKSSGNRHAVILVAGSGPTDRNWCSPLLPGTNGSGRLLAEALANHGFVTLRYDKMASGPRVSENLSKFAGKISMQTHLDELFGAVKTVIAEDGIDNDKVFALTNSEGAIHAVNYQLQAKTNLFKGLVLTGPPGRTIGEVARMQIFAQARNLPYAESIMKDYDAAIADFLASRPLKVGPSIPESAKLLLRGLENKANLPFSRELWNYSLSEHVAKISAPILIMIGKKDIQINWQIDGRALETATRGKAGVSFYYPENANHVLRSEELPKESLTAEYASSHYCSSDTDLDKAAEETIFSWLAEMAKK
ncbi:MAG: alpha/beta hydrolase [Nitrososphaera sp.]